MHPDIAARIADEGLSGTQASGYRDRPTRDELLAAEDERARRDMGSDPYPAGDEGEV